MDIRTLHDCLADLDRDLLQRDAAVRVLLLGALAGEHVLLIGPPGTAKSELARRLHRVFAGALYFERLLTRFSVPEELFGPLSLRALDLCTGSGCLAILLAHAYPEADVDAVDLSSDALAVAQRNVADYGLAGRINLIRSDLYANLVEKSYDLVISNPPYVTDRSMDALPAEYRHEPAMALAGGDDGLDAVRGIVKDAPRFLNPGGLLVVEVGHGRAAVESAYPRMPFVWLETEGHDDAVFAIPREDIVAGR